MTAMLLLQPDCMTAFSEKTAAVDFYQPGETDGIRIDLKQNADRFSVFITSERPLCYLRLRWRHPFDSATRFCGDAWERTYGNSQWRMADPARLMPWYFFAEHDGRIEAFGVKVRPNAMAMWCSDPDGVTLWFDLRSGSHPVWLNGRTLEVGTVVSAVFDRCPAFDAAHRFCAMMCDDPLLPETPVYGSNNGY